MSKHFKPSPARHRRGANRVRIIGGLWRSRLLAFPDRAGLRPTGDRVRETLFNWLGQTLQGKACLDLFAGSGALGFEAASRGADRVLMIESSAEAVESLVENKLLLGAAQCEIRRGDALAYLRRPADRFDIVFVDPPFASGTLAEVLDHIGPSVTRNGMVYVEWGEPIEPLLAARPEQAWNVVKRGKAGVVHFALVTAEASAA